MYILKSTGWGLRSWFLTTSGDDDAAGPGTTLWVTREKLTYTRSPELKNPCLDLPVCFKSSCYLTDTFCSYILRDMQWSTLLNRLWLDYWNVLLRWDLEVSEIDLCFITVLRSLPKEVLVLCKTQFLPNAKEHGSLHMPQLPYCSWKSLLLS